MRNMKKNKLEIIEITRVRPLLLTDILLTYARARARASLSSYWETREGSPSPKKRIAVIRQQIVERLDLSSFIALLLQCVLVRLI